MNGRANLKSKPPVSYLPILFVMGAIGCSGPQNPLNPAGLQSDRISNLWWGYFWVTLFVYCIVILFLFYAIIRVSFRKESEADNQSEVVIPSAKTENRLTVAVGTAVGFTVILLFSLFLRIYLPENPSTHYILLIQSPSKSAAIYGGGKRCMKRQYLPIE